MERLHKIGIWLAAALLCASEAEAAKRVVIDKTHQMLRAYDGDEIVFQCKISTGKEGNETPNGTFRAGAKSRMHYSSRYHNAPMPYSVSVTGHYFIHGYTEVPNRPASHGCIRLPLTNGNPARWFYHWVTPGTPIRITGSWPGSTLRGTFGTVNIMPAAPVAERRARID